MVRVRVRVRVRARVRVRVRVGHRRVAVDVLVVAAPLARPVAADERSARGAPGL